MKIKGLKEKSFFLIAFICLLFIHSAHAQQEEPKVEIPHIFDNKVAGKLEIEVHFSLWTVDLLKGLFEDKLIDEMSDEIRRKISREVRESHAGLKDTGFEQNLAFDSGGSNYGLEIRYYPKGRDGSFSFGISFEKTHMRLSVQGSVTQQFENGTSAEVDAEGKIELNPFFTNLSFRWDMKPTWRVSPYFVLGFGVASLNGEVSYDYIGVYKWAGSDEEVGEADSKTLREAEEDFNTNIPNIIPLLQMNFGLRAEIIPHIHLRVEAGIWDGFILRGGVAYRF